MRAMMPYYDAERQRQGQAAAMLPGLQQMWGNQLATAGGMQEAVDQRGIQEAQAQFAQQNYDPRLAALGAYSGLLGVGAGYGTANSQTSMSEPGGSSLASGLGGFAAGAGIGNALSSGTWLGAGPGSLLGLGPAGWALGGLGLLGGLM